MNSPVEKIDFRPLYLAVNALPFTFTGHMEWLVKVALAHQIAGYLTLGLGRYGSSMSVARLRNNLVEKALKSDATHFLFVDADLIPPDGAVWKLFLLEADIATGVYFSKDDFSKPIPHCMGFSLIRRSVFEKMTSPWFEIKDGQGTEDINFFARATEMGFSIKQHENLVAEHLGVFSNRDKKLKDNKEFINTL